MARPLISILNVETQELDTREMNDLEYEQYLIDKQYSEAEMAAQEAKAVEEAAKKAAKAEALAALGLSQEIVNLLAE
jgi:hypothetical protein